MSTFKETTSPEKNREVDRLVMNETDDPRLSPNTDFSDNPFFDTSDIYDVAFKNFGLIGDTSDKKAFDTSDSLDERDYFNYLEQGDDGKYYDKETEKVYDSIEAWAKAQETLAKRYEGTAKYYEEKAKKEWARFKNSENNGESDAEKWEHYHRAQEYYAKAKECREKSEKVRDKLNKNIDVKNDNNQTESPDNETEKNIRELTDKEKQWLKDTFGWGDEQLSKCTVNENSSSIINPIFAGKKPTIPEPIFKDAPDKLPSSMEPTIYHFDNVASFTTELTADEIMDENTSNNHTFNTEASVDNNTKPENENIKTDDNGNIYSINGRLQPNTTYELNGNIYTTDENGRIISCKAKPVRSPENPRDNEAQRQAGGEDRRPSDQGGHIVGRDLNGDGVIGNLIAMDSKINQSEYKRMENDIKTALDEGKDVTTKTEMTYSGDSKRPDKITVTVTTDGNDTVYKFDNNLDGSLRDEVPENGKEIVQDRLDETGGEISSIKEEYDENGNLVETTVYITYKGDDGTNYRTSVVIDNN